MSLILPSTTHRHLKTLWSTAKSCLRRAISESTVYDARTTGRLRPIFQNLFGRRTSTEDSEDWQTCLRAGPPGTPVPPGYKQTFLFRGPNDPLPSRLPKGARTGRHLPGLSSKIATDPLSRDELVTTHFNALTDVPMSLATKTYEAKRRAELDSKPTTAAPTQKYDLVPLKGQPFQFKDPWNNTVLLLIDPKTSKPVSGTMMKLGGWTSNDMDDFYEQIKARTNPPTSGTPPETAASSGIVPRTETTAAITETDARSQNSETVPPENPSLVSRAFEYAGRWLGWTGTQTTPDTLPAADTKFTPNDRNGNLLDAMNDWHSAYSSVKLLTESLQEEGATLAGDMALTGASIRGLAQLDDKPGEFTDYRDMMSAEVRDHWQSILAAGGKAEGANVPNLANALRKAQDCATILSKLTPGPGTHHGRGIFGRWSVVDPAEHQRMLHNVTNDTRFTDVADTGSERSHKGSIHGDDEVPVESETPDTVPLTSEEGEESSEKSDKREAGAPESAKHKAWADQIYSGRSQMSSADSAAPGSKASRTLTTRHESSKSDDDKLGRGPRRAVGFGGSDILGRDMGQTTPERIQ